jgi:glycosyltransferase involved in cell wall biosynthesis
MGHLSVCFLGGTSYHQPLDRTSEKKFQALKPLGEIFVIGFSQDLFPHRFTKHAHFYLMPKLPLPLLRYIEMFVLGQLLVLWLIFHHSVEVLVTQSPYEGFAASLAKKVAGYLGRKVVLIVESHGDFEESLFLQRRILLTRLHRFFMRCAASFALQCADLVRAVSHSTKEQLMQLIPGKPIFQFFTWTDLEAFFNADVFDKEGSCHNILYAGVLIPRKGVHHLINAFSCICQDFPYANLVIVGRRENRNYTAELIVQAGRPILNGRVQFVEEVSQVELSAWMRKAWMFVLPTYSEGLPRVLFEAMATGTPVISSPVSGIPEIVQNGITGFLVPPGDEVALAERLRWMLEHPEEAREMGCHARAFAKTFFSTETYVDGYRQIFEASQTVP